MLSKLAVPDSRLLRWSPKRRTTTGPSPPAPSKKEDQDWKETTLTSAMNLTGLSALSLGAMLSAHAASKSGFSTAGSLAMGVVGGVGGGTVRDALLGKRAFWLEHTEFLWLSVASGLVGLYGWDRMKAAFRTDESSAVIRSIFGASLGVAAFGGALTSMQTTGGDPLCGALFAGLGACGGGMVRDVLMGRKPQALTTREGLVTLASAAVGSTTYLAASSSFSSPVAKVGACLGATFLAHRSLSHPTFWSSVAHRIGLCGSGCGQHPRPVLTKK